MDNPSIDSFFLTPTDPKEIKSTINSLKNNKATGPNSIPTKLLKTFAKEIKTPLSDLVNLSFECGLFPVILKIANLAPIYKKGDLLECNNYRPISLLSNVSKIIKKLVHKRLTIFLEQKELFYDLQFGFRNNTSTNHALIHITEKKNRKALDNGFFACGVYIDLQKAFDTVKHSILINKLSYYGVRGIANNWFKTLLTNRQHFTSIEENSSDKITNTHGLPQGSVLGPLLFLIYINDLHKAIKNSDVYHYADDTNLLLTHKSPKKINKLINQDLTTLCKWLRANKISLNAAKTEIIIFRRKNTQVLKKLNFCLSGQKIEVTDQVKYLGILLNNTLTWVTHLNDLIKKLNCAIGLLVKIRHYTPKFSLKGIYCSIFNSHLIYGCQVWGQREIESQLLKTIGTLQDKAIRIINFLPNETTVQNIYKKR